MSLAILYEYPETDEEGIKATAQDMGIDLKFIPFRKVSVMIDNNVFGFRTGRADLRPIIEDINVVINRTQSKNLRLYAASILEGFQKHVLNTYGVESVCFSKMRTLIEFWKKKVPIPRTLYVPCDAHDRTTGGVRIHNEETIASLVQQDLGNGSIVIKPDAGTHGKDVRLAQNWGSLVKLLDATEPSTINPVGFVAQEYVEKWFYDLRIVVSKEHGAPPYCYETALARAGFKDFRTNTFLGNMVFGVKLPSEIQKVAVNAGLAVGNGAEAWVVALDAMPNVKEDRFVNDDYIKSELEKLVPAFEKVGEVKRDSEGKNQNFNAWNRRLEEAYDSYKKVEAYENITGIIEESIRHKKNEILFHEANSCPEFWEQTRIIGGVNLAIPLLKCAESVAG